MQVRDSAALRRVLAREIIPLLQEYFYEDWRRIWLVLADDTATAEHQLVRCVDVAMEDLFPDGGNEDHAESADYVVVPEAEITPDAVRKIYERQG